MNRELTVPRFGLGRITMNCVLDTTRRFALKIVREYMSYPRMDNGFTCMNFEYVQSFPVFSQWEHVVLGATPSHCKQKYV